jgi:L-ascorbate metabolism protein UlaG (beta-lactamase superfamily)
MTRPEARLLFIGTATTLIRYGSLTLLTDPNFLHRGQRAYLGRGLTAKRLTEPARTIAELPDLNLVVLSHMHGDHWDREAQRGLSRHLPVVTTPHAARRLKWRGFRAAVPLRTWASHSVTDADLRVTVTAMPGRHAPRPIGRLLPPVMGSMLEFGPASGGVDLRVYVSGDTLLVDELREIPRRYQDIQASVLHLGGTRLPGGLLVTMDAEQGADLMELVKPAIAVPVHYDDYALFKSPLSAFRTEVTRRGIADGVRFVARGDTISLRPTDK